MSHKVIIRPSKNPYHDARHFAGVGCGGLKDEGRMSSLSGQYVDPVLEHGVNLLRTVVSGNGFVMVVDLEGK